MKLLIEQWREYLVEEKKRKNHNEDYPSVKKAKRLKAIGKPDRDSWVAGADDLNRLAHGIAEESGEACGSNPYRDEDGMFSSSKDAKVFTTGYSDDNKRKDCSAQGKWRASGDGKGQASKKKCGRDPKGKKYNLRCKDDVQLWEKFQDETGLIEIEPNALEDIITKILDRELNARAIVESGSGVNREQRFCNAKGYMTMEQFLKRQNAMVASAKGDLLKAKK